MTDSAECVARLESARASTASHAPIDVFLENLVQGKVGLSTQIAPLALTAAIADHDRTAAKRAIETMLQLTKMDIAANDAARLG